MVKPLFWEVNVVLPYRNSLLPSKELTAAWILANSGVVLANSGYCLSSLTVLLEVPGERWRKQTMTCQDEDLNFFLYKDKEILDERLNFNRLQVGI